MKMRKKIMRKMMMMKKHEPASIAGYIPLLTGMSR